MALLAKWSLNSRCIPIQPGSTQGEFTLIKTWRQKINFYLSSSAYLFYVFTFDFWIYKNFFGQSHHVWETLVVTCFLMVINITYIFHIEFYFRKNELKNLLENSFRMEKRCLAMGARNYVNLLMLITVSMGGLSIPATSVFMFASGLFVPCSPPSAGSVLFYSCPNGWMDQSLPWPGRLVNGLILFHAWYLLASLFAMAVLVVLLYPSLVMELQSKLDTMFCRTKLEQYRVAQVMKNLLNYVKRNPMTGLALAFIINTEIESLYAIIMCRDKLPLPILLLFAMALIDFFLVIHVFLRALSKPYVSSVEFVSNFNRLGGMDEWRRKFLKSCQPVKVAMGDGNYFDGLTSLVIWQFCVDTFISIVLM
ncbi:hypothetical protein Fcan01_20892 [Folsomia candida]|uniref:Gustatory receptor n=1 Tax=Folsomia candida TaxID=158441 RepID=A0A226DJL0_FOLCA|nr:hypothetical protein Fcan01_20892 [Folsomia candida]